MDDRELQQYRQTIERLIQELKQASLASSERTAPVSPDNAIGRLTRVDAMQSQQMASALIAQSQLRILRLEQALAFIHAGKYGVCRKCGEEISTKRLDAVPEAVLCVDCAK